jgi:zinc protease
MALALHILRHPSFPSAEFEEFRTQLITRIKGAMSEPGALASHAVARYQNPWPSDDPRYVPSFEELIERYETTSRDDLVSFHNEFYGAGHISVAVVGAFDPEAVVQTLSSSLKGWRKAPAYTMIPYPYEPRDPTFIKIETPDKANAVIIARLYLPMQDTDPDFPALTMANYLLGGAMSSRLWVRIRDVEGVSYGLGSRLSASAFEPDATWNFSGIFAPQNWEIFERGMREEIDLALREGFTEEEVSRGVESLLNLRQLSRSQDGSLVGAWINLMEQNRTFAWTAEFDEKLKALDAQAVSEALRKYIDPEKFIQALAGDFESSTESK